MNKLDCIPKIMRSINQLGPVATEILCDVAGRLADGVAEYGDDFKRGDLPYWLRQVEEESLDRMIYGMVARRKIEEMNE